MTAAAVLDQVCQFFGGPYDSTLHTYHTPQVSGLSVVRRSWAKREDFNEFVFGQAAGTMTGCQMVVQIPKGRDHRVALPAIQGRREVLYAVELHCFIWSKAPFAEDCQDFAYALRDAIVARMRTDPTMGSGGIENNGFQMGEGQPGAEGDVDWDYDQPSTKADGTKAYLLISFTATAYDVG